MHKFIPTHWNRNTHVLVTKYNWPIEEYLKGHAILVHINCLQDIPNIIKNIHEATRIHGFVYTDKYASLETLEINPEWGKTPLILYINRLGQFRNIHHKIGMLRNMNVMLMFTGAEKQATKDAQIASSLGIHSGVSLSPNSQLSDDVLDLITYSFYGTMPHADVEPFATLERMYDGESYVSPFMAQFKYPLRYVYVDKDLNLAFSQEDLDNGVYFAHGLESLYEISSNEMVLKETQKWQQMFINPHPCTFCPAFRVCMGFFDSQKDKGRCKEVMKELLDAIEHQKKRKQLNQHTGCQL